MRKKRKIDFIIYEDNSEKLIFRFYPRQSRCHSFNEEPPHEWKEVYKVYYHYSIIHMWKDDNFHEILFDSRCDECSVIDEVAYRIKLISEGNTTWNVKVPLTGENHTVQLMNEEIDSFAMGVTWLIRQERSNYVLHLWDWQHKGYWFSLNKDKFKEFGEYLNECCEYMLAHGDPI